MFTFHAESEVDTERLGEALAGVVTPGLVVALIGDLGAGKTRLVQATATALGADREEITSPTFVLIQEYQARLTVYHLDTYRLADEDEFLELGVEELFDSGGVCFVEWADRVTHVLPHDLLRIAISVTGASERTFEITAVGTAIEVANRLERQLAT